MMRHLENPYKHLSIALKTKRYDQVHHLTGLNALYFLLNFLRVKTIGCVADGIRSFLTRVNKERPNQPLLRNSKRPRMGWLTRKEVLRRNNKESSYGLEN